MILTSTSKMLIYINCLLVDLLLASSFMLLFAFLVFIFNHPPTQQNAIKYKMLLIFFFIGILMGSFFATEKENVLQQVRMLKLTS